MFLINMLTHYRFHFRRGLPNFAGENPIWHPKDILHIQLHALFHFRRGMPNFTGEALWDIPRQFTHSITSSVCLLNYHWIFNHVLEVSNLLTQSIVGSTSIKQKSQLHSIICKCSVWGYWGLILLKLREWSLSICHGGRRIFERGV